MSSVLDCPLTALTVITDKIYGNMDSKKISILTLCDLSKAFERNRYKNIICKYAKLNTGSFCFASYIKYRSEFVRINSTISKKEYLFYGVLQGSILGIISILFSIYGIDLGEKVSYIICG